MRHSIVPLLAFAVSFAGTAVAQELRSPLQQREDANQTQREDRTALRVPTEGSQEEKGLNGPIAACLILGSQEEVALAQFAQQRAQNPQVKRFAQKMVQDHQSAISQLQSFAPQGVSLKLDGQGQTQPGQRQPQTQFEDRTTTNDANRNDGATAGGDMKHQMLAMQKDIAQKCLALTQRELSEKEGEKFDQCFMAQQIGAHIGMLAKLEGSDSYASAELQQVIEQQQQTVQQHLQQAKQIMQQLEGETATARGTEVPSRR